MIAVAISGMIVALVIPDFNRLIGRYSLECAARELVSDMRAVQQNKMRDENCSFYIQFDNVMDSYYLINAESGPKAYKTTKLPAGVDLYYAAFGPNSELRLFFNTKGNPVNGIGGHATLKDRATGDSLYVIIDSVGRVRISRNHP